MVERSDPLTRDTPEPMRLLPLTEPNNNEPRIDHMDTAYISALAALAGSSIGAFATLATTWLNQSYQSKIQRHANERARREKLFGDFINEAAQAYTDSVVSTLENPSSLVNLYALKSRISLFSSVEIVHEAELVLQAIIKQYFEPALKYSDMDPDSASRLDLLRDFTRACKKEMAKY
jgi:hypothetical protein